MSAAADTPVQKKLRYHVTVFSLAWLPQATARWATLVLPPAKPQKDLTRRANLVLQGLRRAVEKEGVKIHFIKVKGHMDQYKGFLEDSNAQRVTSWQTTTRLKACRERHRGCRTRWRRCHDTYMR